MKPIVSPNLESRREFFRSLAGTVAGFAVSGALQTSFAASPAASASVEKQTLVGSNIYGWGQYAQRENRKLDAGEVISALRDCGYDYLEAVMNVVQPDENARFAEQLKAKGLQPVSLYVNARLHEPEKREAVVTNILAAAKVCRQAGFKVLSCNAEPIGREKTDDELKTQVEGFRELGDGLNTLGIRLAVHQHLPEMANNAREFHYVFDHTRPNVVGWCYDVHWVWKGGIQPLAALKEYGDRVATWHIRQSRKNVWLEILDEGDIDYTAVANYARKHQLARRFSVELALEPGTKITRSVVENHRLSREFIRKVFES